MQDIEADGHQRSPDDVGGQGRSAREDGIQHDGRDAAGQGESGDGGQMQGRLLTPSETVEAQRPHQAEHDCGADDQRHNGRQRCGEQAAGRHGPDHGDGDDRHGGDVGAAEPVDGKARGMTLARVQPDLGTKGSASRGPAGLRWGQGPGRQSLEARHVEPRGGLTRIGKRRRPADIDGACHDASLHRRRGCHVNAALNALSGHSGRPVVLIRFRAGPRTSSIQRPLPERTPMRASTRQAARAGGQARRTIQRDPK